MVARGDLAIEIPAENVPSAQKMLIKKCNQIGKPVITATQMLESMIKSPVPTRAEVSDIANAIMDGTDAVMLSEETTLGDFPIEAVRVMSRVAEKMENDPIYLETVKARRVMKDAANDEVDAITIEAVNLADRVNAKCIVALTHTGFTPQMIARFKPMQPLVAFSPEEVTARQLLLSFGCIPFANKKFKTFSEAMNEVKKVLLKQKLAVKGDKIVVSAGVPFEKQHDTNMVLVETL
jgi:pyruvate kinase